MKTNWTITGTIKLSYSDPDIGSDTVPLEHVDVKVSAREKILGVWGPWNSWDNVRTKPDGSFSLTKEKDKSKRQFKVEVQFKDEEIKIYPDNEGVLAKLAEGAADLTIGKLAEDALEQILEQTGRLVYDVRWFTVYQEDKNDTAHEHNDHLGKTFTFGGGSHDDLDDAIAQKHALAWFVYKKVLGVVNGFGGANAFSDQKPVALKYPHNNPLVPDSSEASYSDPYNKVTFIVRNTQTDDFDVATIMHELMHIWAYQHCKNEKKMAWQLLIHQRKGLHALIQNQSFVAFHEGFAEWASNRLMNTIFTTMPTVYGEFNDTGLPFSRSLLKEKKVTKSIESDKSEYAWMSLFNILMTPDLQLYDFNASANQVAKLSKHPTISRGDVCLSPALSFAEILDVFNPHTSAGYDKVLKRDEMNLDDFLERAKDISDKITQDHVEAIKILLDPSKTDSAVSVICLPPKAPGKPGEDWKPPKDLHEPPVTSGRRRADNKKETDKAGSRANRRPATKQKDVTS